MSSGAIVGDRVVAVVVTFEAPERLRACLGALASQTRPPDRMVVVNNGAPLDGRLSVPDSVVLIDSETNTGPAGGYHLGIERALDMGATWLWLMDDDID
ncbi:MAG: glycosyltransferase, partial [Actinobacteria bacterium]|nr:glycosyltransferase [Actinomycetota bacterium]